MKKMHLASILGIAASVALVPSTFGQGQVAFQNTDFGAGALDAPVTFDGPGMEGGNPVTAGMRVGASFKADLLYSLDGGSTWLDNAHYNTDPSQYPTEFGLGTGAPNGDNDNYAGFFFGPWVVIPDYTSGPISFIVRAFNGDSYDSSQWFGQSDPFTLPSIATGTTPASDFGAALQPFSVTFVPEPSSLALLGLAASSLLMFRRRK